MGLFSGLFSEILELFWKFFDKILEICFSEILEISKILINTVHRITGGRRNAKGWPERTGRADTGGPIGLAHTQQTASIRFET